MIVKDASHLADALKEIASSFEWAVKDIKAVEKKMRDTGDLEYASVAINIIRNCFGNLRTDLLITRLLRCIDRDNRKGK